MMDFINMVYMRRGRTLLILILLPVMLNSVHGQSERKFIRQGNNKFSGGKYPDSEISYRKAIDKNKMLQDAVFNLGDALYKQNKFDDAGKVFLENSGATIDKQKKANSFFNLGNSLLNNKKIEESIEAYKNSLILHPGNQEAKYNLAYAQDLLKRQQDQQKQNQNKDNKDNKDQQKKDKNQDNKENKDQNKDQQKPPDQQQSQQTISKEDAQRILDALANDEKKVQEKVRQEKAARTRVKTIINW